MSLNEKDVLAYDPFAGDFGGSGANDRMLKDQMVNAAKAHGGCHNCGGEIAKGERRRVRAEIFDDELLSYRWCALCCEAMALSWTDAGDAITARQGLHRPAPVNEAAP